MRYLIATALLCVLSLDALAQEQCGRASWYHEGQVVACGGRFNPDGLTAASRELRRGLPCGTKVEVTNTRNGKRVIVTINDHGPAAWTGNIIDLSRGAARILGMIASGLAPVCFGRIGK